MNTFRASLAEYIVSLAIRIANETRNDWEPVDLVTPDGLRFEVKSSAYIQAWEQDKLSAISFSIESTRTWNSNKNQVSPIPSRESDVYVFCLLKHKDQATLNPLQLEQWDFYVLPTSTLDKKLPNQKIITLSSLLKLKPTLATFSSLRRAILEPG